MEAEAGAVMVVWYMVGNPLPKEICECEDVSYEIPSCSLSMLKDDG